MNAKSMAIGAAAGSALMFILDPNRGARRRALMRDQMIRAGRKTRDGLDATARDIANRTSGVAAEARGLWSDDRVGDATLVARVRATLGRVCSHPHAVRVDARDGDVTLRGPILASEVDDVLAAARAVRGAAAVHNELEVHESADGVPALQGEGRLAEPSLDILQHNWAPATRAIVSASLLATGAWMLAAAMRGSRDGGHRHDGAGTRTVPGPIPSAAP